MYIHTRRPCYVVTVPFERSEPFHLLRLMGMSVQSLHIQSIDTTILTLLI